MTDAAPTPRPPRERQAMRSHVPNASPEPTAEAVKSTAATTMTRTRPWRAARGPANQAPTTQPSSAEETVKPWRNPLMPKSALIASMAPLMTAVSKPKRKPPRAAARLMPRIRALNDAGGPSVLLMVPSSASRAGTLTPTARVGTGGGCSAGELVVPIDDGLAAAADGGGEAGLLHRHEPGDGRARRGAHHVDEVGRGDAVAGPLQDHPGTAEDGLGGDPGGQRLGHAAPHRAAGQGVDEGEGEGGGGAGEGGEPR